MTPTHQTVYVLYNYNDATIHGVFKTRKSADDLHSALDDEWMGSAPRGLESPLPLSVAELTLQP